VDLVKESIENNSLKEAPLISHEAPIVHPFDVDAKKAQGNTNVVEAPQYSSSSNPPIEVIEPSFSSFSHHKSYKKDTRKWGTKKKRYGDHHFKLGPKGVLGMSRLKLFLGKLKSSWLEPFIEVNVSPRGVIKAEN
ncbi:hypothetical protein TorRG33x02_230470, partial [Trema orientale]